MSVAAKETFVPLARGFYLEGLLVDGDNIWFTDVITGGVRRVGSDQVLLKNRTMIGGLLLNADGSLLAAGKDDQEDTGIDAPSQRTSDIVHSQPPTIPFK